jgi:Thylakoid formation protein
MNFRIFPGHGKGPRPQVGVGDGHGMKVSPERRAIEERPWGLDGPAASLFCAPMGPRLVQVFALGFVSVVDQVLDGLPEEEKQTIINVYVEALNESPEQYRKVCKQRDRRLPTPDSPFVQDPRHAPQYRQTCICGSAIIYVGLLCLGARPHEDEVRREYARLHSTPRMHGDARVARPPSTSHPLAGWCWSALCAAPQPEPRDTAPLSALRTRRRRRSGPKGRAWPISGRMRRATSGSSSWRASLRRRPRPGSCTTSSSRSACSGCWS